MSIEHSNLTDKLLGSHAIRKDPLVLPHLQQSLQAFRELARGAINHESTNGDACNESLESSVDTSDFAPSEHASTTITTIDPLDTQDQKPSLFNLAKVTQADDTALILLQNLSEAESSPLHHPLYFGTHWTSYGPWTVAPRVVSPRVTSATSARAAYPFGLETLFGLLNIGYNSLANQYGYSFSIAQSFFRFAFTDFTSQELSFIIRWYLSLGKDELPCLGFATLDFDESYEVPGKPTIQSLPNARITNKGGYYPPYPSFEVDYLSFFEMDSFLRSLGVFEFNTGTFSMLTTLPNPLLDALASDVPQEAKGRVTPPKWQNAFNFDSFFNQSPSIASDALPFAGIPAEHTSNDLRTLRQRVFIVSIPKFFEELSTITVCLRHGPAIIRSFVQPAVLASVISVLDL
jgi:hypothetical protein